jgi:hypothetical protein
MTNCAGCGRPFPNLKSLIDHHPRRCYKLRHGRLGPPESEEEHRENIERQRVMQLDWEEREMLKWPQIYGRNH